MTTFIIHGGQAGDEHKRNDAFFREMVRGVAEPVNILLVPFARVEPKRTEVVQRHSARLQRVNEGVKLHIIVADETRLAEQIASASVVYIVGGETARLVSALRSVPNIVELLQGKILAGSSAGAYALVKYYWENDTHELGEGLGLLNTKAFAHFSPASLSEYQQLANYKENLPIIALPEGDWVRLES
jgi:peptidase E